MALSATSLLSLEELKEELRVNDVGKDEQLRRLAEVVTDVIEGHLGRQIVTRGPLTEFHTMECDGKALDTNVLVTLDSPLIAVTSIHENGVALVGADFVANMNGRIYRLAGGGAGVWPGGFRAVKVVYEAGYASTATVPERIKFVARRLAGVMWEEFRRDIRGVSSMSDQLGNVTRFSAATLTKDMAADLHFERRRRIFETGERDA